MQAVFSTVFFLLLCASAFGQGTVRGKVTDRGGEALIGVTVVVKGNTNIGAATDLDGNYSIELKDNTPVVLLVTYVGFKPVEETVSVSGNGVVVKNFTLLSSAQEVKEVEISAKAVKAADYYMENMKKQSSTTIDYVSSETMRKTGDNSVSSAISRVTGVANTSAGFITVRGIGDRYLKTTINGSVIPTLDPFTNNIKLDFIPANLVDNIIITKTASPDLPGSWAGAYVSVETRDYPEQLTIAAETQLGYNTQSTFKNVLSGERSSTDWMGFDKDLRDRQNGGFIDYVSRPTQFQEMVALGLGAFYQNLGITQSWDPNSQIGNDLFKLGLIELGLLAPALINDPTAYNQALQNYQSSEALEAFSTINAAAAEQNKNFSDSWLLNRRKAPLNFSQSFGIGNQLKAGKQGAIGYLFGLRYASSVQFDSRAELNRARINANDSLESNTFYSKQEFTREINSWSALAKLAWKPNGNHSLSALFMPNFNGANNLRTISGRGIFEDQPDALYLSTDQFYEERKQLVYQLQTDHYLPFLKARIHLDASYTDGSSNIPDYRSLSTFLLGGQLLSGLGNLPNTRDFRYLNEDMMDSRISVEFPLKEKPGKSRKLKFGGAYTYLDREFNQYEYILGGTDSSGNVLTGSYSIPGNDIGAFLDPSNFLVESYSFEGIPRRRSKIIYVETDVPGNHTIGHSEVIAYYAMLDYSLSFKWRVSGGLRVEHAEIFADIYDYDRQGLKPGDIRRKAPGDDFLANPGDIKVTKLLPSLNVIYKYLDDDTRSMNIRANYSRTTAYPSIREITENNILDFELRSIVFGNSDLKPADVNNFDLRWEGYFKGGNSISASAFYKKFINHIELLNFNETNTWTNVDESYVAGIELEGVKKITANLEFRFNAAIIKSETKVILKSRKVVDGNVQLVPYDTLVRSMYGQAPFLINAMLNYTLEKWKSAITVSYNLQGKRLVIAATENIPDIYEMPRNVVDVRMTRQLGKHFTASFTVRDILNEPVRRRYDLKYDQKLNYDSYRWGTGFNLGLTYRL
ncbi:MAG: carboxypeptidase-like regulatory domain-containing protein [Bacteroidia bacterium]|nr:carboxypeptidase-like regulatory domain-containing protein [Bacteroidia bacterium]